jgi:hypothetical protein
MFLCLCSTIDRLVTFGFHDTNTVSILNMFDIDSHLCRFLPWSGTELHSGFTNGNYVKPYVRSRSTQYPFLSRLVLAIHK